MLPNFMINTQTSLHFTTIKTNLLINMNMIHSSTWIHCDENATG